MKLVLAGILGTVLSVGAFAEEAKIAGVEIDGKKIAIESVGKHGDERILHSKDLQDGIYIVAVAGPYSKTIYPNATNIIRERFAASGFKVVDKAEGSALGIQFFTMGALDLENADKAAAASILPTANQVGINAPGFVLGVANVGIAGGIAYIAGGLLQSSSKAVMSGFSLLKPNDNKMFKSSSAEKDPQFSDGIKVNYKLEKENKASDDIVLKMVTDQWIKSFLVLDAAPAEPVAASATTEILAAAKQ